MQLRKASASGFTLIELMIVVAIIGVLASIAIPEYQKYTFRAKQSESLTLMGAIKNAEFAHFALYDCFVNVEATPLAMNPGVIKQTWDSIATANANAGCANPAARSFEDLAVKPNHPFVYYEYQCSGRYSVTSMASDDFTCSAYGDIDGDMAYYELVYGTDFDNDGMTIPSPHGTVSFFPGDPVRVSVGIY